jgi:arsenate reductase
VARVVFVCIHNAGRSQMSRAFFARLSNGRHEAGSAGTQPIDAVHPEVAAAMREVGFEFAAEHPHALTDELAGWADVIVTMGCGDECPYIPGKRYIDWDLPDPHGQSVEEVRRIRDDIENRVIALIGQLDGAQRPRT